MIHARGALGHRMRQHKVLRVRGKPLNMLKFKGARCALGMQRKELSSHASDTEEESEEDHIEGCGEAEGREEDEEEIVSFFEGQNGQGESSGSVRVPHGDGT
jgi:hypothetical protein